MRSRVLIAILAFAVFMPRSNAEINVGTSVEWLSCSSEVIVTGKVTKVNDVEGPGKVTYEECTIKVERVFKGKVEGKELSFTLRRIGDDSRAGPLLKSDGPILFFLSKSRDHGPEKHLEGKWVPTPRAQNGSIVDLSRPITRTYSKEMKILDDSKELLKIVAVWAASPVKHFVREDVPGGPLHEELYAGSAVYLIVPAEEKHRLRFLKMARSPEAYTRSLAAGELWKFPGDETEKVLRDLLKDDSESFSHYSQDQIAGVEYHVRAAAHRSLTALGKKVEKMQLQRDPTAEEQQALRVSAWGTSFSTALKGGGWTIAITDGATRRIDGRDHTIVVVTCSRDKQKATFTLVPRDWPAANRPKSDYLGTNGLSSQGARRFYLEGTLPEETKTEVSKYFGLEK